MSGTDLQELVRLLPHMSEEDRRELDKLLTAGLPAWMEQTGPQMRALMSPADILYYGGQAGGGKTDLLIGAALTQHEKSIIFRREAVQLVGLEERVASIMGSRNGYNSQDAIWRLPPNDVSARPTLEFGSCREPGDWMKYQGRPHDLIGFDEIPHFLELQFRALIGWKRTDNPNIRQRVICAGNPPTDAEGEWVIRYWAPWLDPMHPNPAKDGELRWFVTDESGKDLEVSGPEDSITIDGVVIRPESRTFIRSSVDDNLFLTLTGYKRTLLSLPEPLRSQMARGDFMAGRSDAVWQAIPTAWVKAAQARWKPRENKGPMTALGLDPSRGGLDSTTAARRHGQWFDELVQAPGVQITDGPKAAAFVAPLLRNGAPVAVDAIGIGSSALDFIVGMGLRVHAVVGSEGSKARSKDGNLRFKNKRAEMYWRLREALDPTAEEPIALPPDQELLADLCAVRYKVVSMGQALAGIQMRDKDEIREALGRSPDKGDAVAMTFVDGLPPPGRSDDAAAFRRLRGLVR